MSKEDLQEAPFASEPEASSAFKEPTSSLLPKKRPLEPTSEVETQRIESQKKRLQGVKAMSTSSKEASVDSKRFDDPEEETSPMDTNPKASVQASERKIFVTSAKTPHQSPTLTKSQEDAPNRAKLKQLKVQALFQRTTATKPIELVEKRLVGYCRPQLWVVLLMELLDYRFDPEVKGIFRTNLYQFCRDFFADDCLKHCKKQDADLESILYTFGVIVSVENWTDEEWTDWEISPDFNLINYFTTVEPLSVPFFDYLFKKDPEYSDRTIRNRQAWYSLRLERMLHCELSLPKAFECENASHPVLPEQPVVLPSSLAQKTISLVSPKSVSAQTKASASRSASFTTSAPIPKLSQSEMLRSVASHPQPSVAFVPSATRSHMSPIPQASGYIPTNSPTASRQTSQTPQPASFSSFASFGSGNLQPANQWITIQNPDPYPPRRKVAYQTELHLQDPAHD